VTDHRASSAEAESALSCICSDRNFFKAWGRSA